MRHVTPLALAILLCLGACKDAKIVGEVTTTWRADVGEGGVAYQIHVAGDDARQPLIVLLHRWEMKNGPDPVLWKTVPLDRRGVSEVSVNGKAYPYKGSPILVVASTKGGVHEIREGVLPPEWIPRLREQIMLSNGHQDWTMKSSGSAWKALAEPMFGSPK